MGVGVVVGVGGAGLGWGLGVGGWGLGVGLGWVGVTIFLPRVYVDIETMVGATHKKGFGHLFQWELHDEHHIEKWYLNRQGLHDCMIMPHKVPFLQKKFVVQNALIFINIHIQTFFNV